jgi:hypothetical protein
VESNLLSCTELRVAGKHPYEGMDMEAVREVVVKRKQVLQIPDRVSENAASRACVSARAEVCVSVGGCARAPPTPRPSMLGVCARGPPDCGANHRSA